MRLLIDCDPGVDDALALIVAAAHPQPEILAVTTVAGNVGVDLTTRNAHFVLDLLGLDVPVTPGARGPLHRAFEDASDTHGGDGLGNLSRFRLPDGSPKYALAPPAPSEDQAAQAIVDLIQAHSGEVTLVATGPLTNLAHALEVDPAILGRLSRLVIMGGAYRVRGNVRPWAEYNFWCDPDAAALVVSQPVPKTLVGLDVTHQVVLERTLVENEIRPIGSVLSEFVCDATEAYAAFDSRTYGVKGNFIHDAVALAAALEQEIVSTKPMCVRVETETDRAGQCVIDHGPSNAEVATSVDAARVLSMLQEAIEAGPRR